MSETQTQGGLILPTGVKAPAVRVTDGSCPECGAEKKRFFRNFGGVETCMDCGYDREQGANG